MKIFVIIAALCMALLLFAGCAPSIPQTVVAPQVAEQASLTPSRIIQETATLSFTATPLPTATSPLTPTPIPTATVIQTATRAATSSLLSTPIPNNSGLTIEENEIKGIVELEPLRFKPVYGTQQEVLDRNSYVKQEPNHPQFHNLELVWNTEKSQYRVDQEGKGVVVTRDGWPIFQAPVGDVSPIFPLRQFWADEEHWVLEIAFAQNTYTDNNGVITKVVGQIYQDGVLLNEQYGYEEMFGFQILAGKPFYFYKKDGKIHAAYEHQDLPVVYDNISHYLCCSAAVKSPVMMKNLIGFFGQRDGIWYYTEIGQF